jgi:hypothetical protein
VEGKGIEVGIVVTGHGFLRVFVRIVIGIVGYIKNITRGENP